MVHGKMQMTFGERTNGGDIMKKLKVENLPLICVVTIIIILIVALIVNSISNQNSTKSVDSNYQATGMVDETKFSIMRAYYKDSNLVIENNIDTSEDGSIQNKSIYYKLGTDTSDDVISQGFLTKQITIPKSDIYNKGNIRIQIYGVTDESEVENSETIFQIMIDKDEIVDYVNIFDSMKNYDDLNDSQKKRLIKYIDLNYVNDRLINYYSNDVQTYLEPYLKADDESKSEELQVMRKQVIDKYKYYKQLADLIGIDFDELIKNSIAINDTYYMLTAIQKSIDYVNEQMKEQIGKLEVQAVDSGINLTDYNEQKNNYPLKEQYEYLQEQINKKNDTN